MNASKSKRSIQRHYILPLVGCPIRRFYVRAPGVLFLPNIPPRTSFENDSAFCHPEPAPSAGEGSQHALYPVATAVSAFKQNSRESTKNIY